jgi:ferric-dicitrate binding protein FerR (iron transport regulator)
MGSVTRMGEGGLGVRFGLAQQRTLRTGDVLRAGDRLTARGPVLVTLMSGGTLRIAAGSTLAVTGAAELSLERGLIYLDIPPRTLAANPFRVTTSAGVIEHVGTEFEIKSDDQTVRVRVREGRIRFLGAGGAVVADAGTELLAVPGKTLLRRSIATYGGDWIWTASLAPTYEIEGRPLIGFLTWVSRELGRPLDFADANARQIAGRTILHGSIHNQAPIDAMSNVLATTSLTYEIRGDTIWVRSGP